MIKYTKDDKTLVIPSGLGFGGQGSGSGGGVTPQQAAEIASAVTEAAIDEYDTEIQVDLEELRDAISASTGTLLDLAEIAAMSIADRVALFDEVFEKASNGEKIYIKGLVQEEAIRTAILPLVSYRPETNPVLHQGGNLYFAAKGDTDNVYFHVALTSEGSIDPTSGNIIKRNIYNLPTASAEVKGGVRIGSGLTMTQDTLSVDTTGLVTDGDLAPFIVQQSANTQDIASLSAATEAISESLGNYATTATTDALSAVTSALTENVDALSAATSALTENLETLSGGTPTLYSAGTAYTWCVIYDYDTINSLSTNQKKEILTEIKSYGGQGKFTYIRKLGESGRNQFFPQSKLTSAKAEYYSLGGENYDYVTLTSAGLLSNGYKAIYTLPTAAVNKKGGVKVGSGLTMNGEVMSVNIGEGLAFSGDTLVVSGGTGGVQNYVIADTLDEITNPVEGMLAYVKYRRMNGWIIDASQITEGYAANVYYDGNSYVDVYRSGVSFFWDWNNDATDWAFGNNIWYKIDKENGLFYAACDNPNAYISVISPATTASTIAQMNIDQLYLYNGTAWEPKYFPPTDIYFENMTAGERMNLYDEITDLLGGSNTSPNLSKLFSRYRFFTSAGQIDGQVMSEVYFSNFENDEIWFYGTKTSKVSYPVDIYRVTAHIDSSGTLQTQVNSFRDSLSE